MLELWVMSLKVKDTGTTHVLISILSIYTHATRCLCLLLTFGFILLPSRAPK